MDNYHMFRNLMVMAAADEKFTDEEISLLAVRSARWGITDQQFEEALAYAKTPSATFSIPEDRDEQERLLKNLLEVMAADGELAHVEKRMFAVAAAKMGFSGEQLGRLLDDMLMEQKIALPYVDPEAWDSTPQEATTYDERNRQMTAEMC